MTTASEVLDVVEKSKLKVIIKDRKEGKVRQVMTPEEFMDFAKVGATGFLRDAIEKFNKQNKEMVASTELK